MQTIKNKLKQLYPKRIDQAKFFGVKDANVPAKLRTIENKLKWLRTTLKPLGLTVKIEEDEKD